MHEELLRLAKVLAADLGGLPRWVAHNRAVSTAYYAVFHAIAELCARQLVGAWKPWPAFRQVYRSLDHGRAAAVFKDLQNDNASGRSAKDLGQIFVDLQKARHSADYDPGYRASPAELQDLIMRAELGIALIQQVPSAERKLLAARLIGRTRG